jgi:hypothetical protein
LYILNQWTNFDDHHQKPRLTVPYRFHSEGASTIASYLSDKRIVHGTVEDVKVFLEKEHPKLSELSIATREKLESLAEGSVLLKVEPLGQIGG